MKVNRRFLLALALLFAFSAAAGAIVSSCGKAPPGRAAGGPNESVSEEHSASPEGSNGALKGEEGVITTGRKEASPPAGNETQPDSSEGSFPHARQPVEPLAGAVLVVVENHPEARPQRGLTQAAVVYESDVIAGITRFLVVYQTKGAPEIGPVRSLRKHLLEIAAPYGSPVVHSGGSEDAYGLLRSDRRLKSLDEIQNAGAWFWRDPSRKAPHNLYTSTNLIQRAAKAKGYRLLPADPVKFSQSPSLKLDDSVQDASHISIPFSEAASGRNVVEYRYEDGKYLRQINGKPHVSGGEALEAANVFVLFVPTKVSRSFGEPQLLNQVIGSGRALFFTQGKALVGRWEKPSIDAHFKYLVPSSAALQPAPGQTWVELVGSQIQVRFR